MNHSIHRISNRISIGLVFVVIGCGPSPTIKPPVVTTAPSSPTTIPVVPEKFDSAKTEKESEKPDTDETLSTKADTTPVPPPESLERVLLLTQEGPLVIEIALTIDGQPFDAGLSRLTAEALAAGDTDGDGRATWKEVLASPKFKNGQFGNNPITADMTLKTITEQYDTNRDGLMNAAEVPKFITKNVAGARAFSLRSSKQNQGDNVNDSPVRRWLDEDGDKTISADEIAAAPVRLLARDADDDDLLVPSDFVAPAANLSPEGAVQRPTMSRRFGSEIAYWLGPKAKWNSVLVGLVDVCKIEDLGTDDVSIPNRDRPKPFPLVPGLFDRLDADKNGRLDVKEVAALATIEPQLKLVADFGHDAENKQPLAKLRLKSIAPEIADSVKVRLADESRLALSLPGATLEVYVRDATPPGNYEAQAEAILAMYDGDKNGYLEKKELPEENPGVSASFETLDTDGDGKIYVADIAAQLARQQAALYSQIQARAGDQEDAFFAALDGDADGRLSSREIASASARLAALDTDGNGKIDGDDNVPGSLALGLVRGDSQAENASLVAPPPAPRPRAADIPPWFARMDTNEDGEISPTEFLGSLAKFKSLDANGDGYLSLEEMTKGE